MCFDIGSITLGAGAKTRLESSITKFTPHCICRRVYGGLCRLAAQQLVDYTFNTRMAQHLDSRCVLPATKTRLKSSMNLKNV